MSTWIFRLAPVLLLAGCVGSGLGLGGGTDRVALTSDRIAVVGPRGFCVDETETRDTGGAAFAVFGNCAVISDSRLARQPQTPAVLTAAISEPSAEGGITATMGDLTGFFRSADGAAVLSRSGDPESVTVMQTFVAGDIFYLRATDTSPGTVPGVEDTYWRAYFDMGVRIATFSVLAVEGQGTGEADQLSILENFVATTRAENQGSGAADAGAATVEGPELFNSGLFRRILGPRQR